MIDHATGVVIGSTCCIGYGCTFLHNTTLGSTGKEDGDRHPKLGNNVMVGQGSSTLGNIFIGDNVKIGALSIVLKDMPADATVVGNPARIVRINSNSGNIFSSKAADRLKVIQDQMGSKQNFDSTIELKDFIAKNLPYGVNERSVNMGTIFAPRAIIEKD